MDIDNILNTINKNLTKIDNYIDKIVTDILFIKVSDKSTQTECICCKICCPRRKNVHKYSDEEQVHLMKNNNNFVNRQPKKQKKVKFYNINEFEHLYNQQNH